MTKYPDYEHTVTVVHPGPVFRYAVFQNIAFGSPKLGRFWFLNPLNWFSPWRPALHMALEAASGIVAIYADKRVIWEKTKEDSDAAA